MADQPSPQSPNSNRISAMLQDLAAQRAQPAAPVGAPPANLPGATSIARPTAPAPAPRQVPNTPMPTRPPMPPPPRPPAPVAPRAPIAPAAPIAPRPVAAPAPVAPVAPAKPVAPAAPAQNAQYTGQLRTMAADIGQVSTGRAPTPVNVPAASVPAAAAPTAPTPTTPSTAPSGVVIPPASGGSFTKKLIYIVMGLIVFAVAAWILVGFIGSPAETTTPTPKPSATVSATTTPTGKSLNTYFPKAGPSVNLKNTDSAVRDMVNAITTAQPSSKQALRVVLSGDKTGSLADFLDLVGSPVPSGLKSALGAEWTALAYGQSEQFDINGGVMANAAIKSKLVLISQVSNATAANQAVTTWEGNGLASNSATLLGFVANRAIVRGFSSGTYRQIPVRYWNFPYADSSIDWAIVTASNNKNYLVISSSRESLFFAIDQLMQ